jgi:type II secretion system protein J
VRRRRRQPAGFTLLELTLALGVTAMLALSLYKSLGVCLQARRSATATVENTRAASIAMELICRDFESVPPPTGLLSQSFIATRQLGPTGEADFVDFFTIGADGVEPRQPFDEGVRQIELALRTDVTPPVLVRRIIRNLMPRVQTEPEEEILCRNVRSLTLRYFDGYEWLEEWDSTVVGNVLPMAVQVILELEDPTADAGSGASFRTVRIVPLACAKPVDESATDTGQSSGTGSGGTGGGS